MFYLLTYLLTNDELEAVHKTHLMRKIE